MYKAAFWTSIYSGTYYGSCHSIITNEMKYRIMKMLRNIAVIVRENTHIIIICVIKSMASSSTDRADFEINSLYRLNPYFLTLKCRILVEG